MPRAASLRFSSSAPAGDDALWAAVVARDKSFDGKFLYAVATTGVYCKPSCPARLPKRSNVSFFTQPADAERAGFHACKRCRPNEPSLEQHYAEKVAQACRMMETAELTPKLNELAAQANLSPFHFHRIFKAIAGVTPKAYAAAGRQKRVVANLSKPVSITEAIIDAGYSSNGRFYAESSQVLGMTPTEFRSGSAKSTISFAIGQCSLGAMLVAASNIGVCAVLMGDDPDVLLRDLQDRFPKAHFAGGDGTFEKLAAEVIALVEQPGSTINLPLDVRGTVFQHRVWQALRGIPAGSTMSYAELAARIGKPKAVRAVASACAANPIAVVVPCHRVVRIDGALSGYRWGIERKRALLAREAQFKKAKVDKP